MVIIKVYNIIVYYYYYFSILILYYNYSESPGLQSFQENECRGSYAASVLRRTDQAGMMTTMMTTTTTTTMMMMMMMMTAININIYTCIDYFE